MNLKLPLRLMRQALLVTLFTLMIALILPVRFAEMSFTCGFSRCGIGKDSSYMVEDVTWHWFGGYHMFVWQHFTPQHEMQGHWLEYNYKPTDVLVLLGISLGMATAILFLYRGHTTHTKNSSGRSRAGPYV